MGFYATDQLEAVLESHQENLTPPSKNRVWNFFTTSETCAGFFESQPVEPHQEKWPTPTKPVSGVRYYGLRYYQPETGRWASRDPMGERGRAKNIFLFCANSPQNFIDIKGLYECRSEAKAARDPWYGMIWSEYENASGCSAVFSHTAQAIWHGPNAICNSATGNDMTHLRIEAKSPCCRKYNVTCAFVYFAEESNSNPGTPNTANGITLPVTILDESFSWTEQAKPGPTGIWGAQLTKVMAKTKTIEIGPSWRMLFDSWTAITAGTREGLDSGLGAWLGAGFTEVFAASCSLTDAWPCL